MKKWKIMIGGLCTAMFFVGTVSPLIAAESIEECSRELLLAYFPAPFVQETLKKHNVSENQWKEITSALESKDAEVIKLVEQKASTMNPNPLLDPQARQAAVKLFRETLLQIFSDVMKQHGITDEKQISEMLDDVQQQKAQRFAKCMQTHQEAKTNPAPENFSNQE